MVTVNWARLREGIIAASVQTVNALLYEGLDKAERDVPVRRVFRGGKPRVRFKTAEEIEGDKELRSRLGLAPEILATPKAVAAVFGAGLNPRRGTTIGGKAAGFARTVTHPDRGRNSWRKSAEARELDPLANNRALREEVGYGFLTARGKYELEKGRAISQVTSRRFFADRPKLVRAAGTKSEPGSFLAMVGEGTFHDVAGPAHLGGGLKKTLRVQRASAETYPVIKGSLLAGDREHDYAKYQELGTRHNAAHPFLRPRLIEWKDLLEPRLRRAIRRSV